MVSTSSGWKMPNGPPSLLSSQSPSSPPTLPSGTEAMITAGYSQESKSAAISR